MRTYRNLPPIVNGYPLDDVWSVVVPIARTNLVINPSFETNTTSWTAIGGSIARSTTQQYHGAYSLAITPTATTTDGARYDTVSLTSGTTYAYSAKVRGVAGLKYKIAIETTGAVELNSVTFLATGRWQWISGYYTETSSTTRRFTVRKAAHVSTAVFYLDGVQVEAIAAGELVSTYIDGDQQGLVPNQQPPAFVWNGTPHASTSTRSGLTRAGGMVIPFKKYGFILTAMIGLGLAGVQNVATDYARIDGSYDDYTRKPARQFTLTGRFQGRTYAELRRNRSGLAQLLDRDLIGQDQRLTLLRHVEDYNRNITTSDIRMLAKYESGLGGNTDNQAAETAPITFTQYLPNILSDGESGASLGVQTTVASVSGVAERLNNGTWRAISATFNNEVRALNYGSNSALYIGGAFTVPQTHVAVWDGTTLSAMGAGLSATITSLVIAPDGTVYAGGLATMTIGGVNGTVAKFSGGAWSIVGATNTMLGLVQQLTFARDGTLFAVGTSPGGKATLDSWNGTAWTNILTSAANGTAFAVAEGINGLLYVGGNFLNLNADANQDGIAAYNRTAATWAALGTGLNGNIEDEGISIGLDGRVYIAGNFTTAGGNAALGAAVWNGVSWNGVGGGFTGGVGSVVRTLSDGSILYGGTFTTINGVTFPDPLARWLGGAFVSLDANLPTDISNSVLSLATAIDGRLAVGFFGGAAPSITTAAQTTITNPGTARSYPTIIINGPSSGTARIWSITNPTTNRAIYLNLTLSVGEVATLIFTPDNLSFTSTFQGNIASTIMPGSNQADFFLQPGANIVSFFSASSTVTATINWRPAYASMDDVP